MDKTTEGHIFKRYDGELNHLHYLILEMGGLVVDQLRDALEAFKTRDPALARRVIERDAEVDRLEVGADDKIVELIIRRCPVSADLRLVIAVSKGVSDLERIGDEAVRIAGLVVQVFGQERGGEPNIRMLRDVHRMGELALASLWQAVEVFEVWDEDKARQVIEKHQEMDDEFQADLRHLLTYVLEDTRNIGFAIGVVLVIKALERIGHHAQNLAEYAIFQARGEDVRHRQP